MSDEAKMEPWRSDAERRDCYCATQRKPCSYHEGYADGWDAGTDAVLVVVRGVDADQWEQVGWQDVYGWLYLTTEVESPPEGAEPVYRRVVPVVPSLDRCPTCGSIDRGERLSVPVPVDVPGLHTRCPDPWHRVLSTEPKEGP